MGRPLSGVETNGNETSIALAPLTMYEKDVHPILVHFMMLPNHLLAWGVKEMPFSGTLDHGFTTHAQQSALPLLSLLCQS